MRDREGEKGQLIPSMSFLFAIYSIKRSDLRLATSPEFERFIAGKGVCRGEKRCPSPFLLSETDCHF